MAQLHPVEASHGALLQHAAVKGGGEPVVAQVEALQPLEGGEHRLDGAESVVRDVQVTQTREGGETRVQAGQFVVRHVKTAQVLELPDAGVMMVSSLTRVTAQEMGEVTVGH